MLPNHDYFAPLLTNPPGSYALSPYGATHAVILTGSPEFHTRGFNLFASLGGGDHQPLARLRRTDCPNVVWFCLGASNVRQALNLYFYNQLYQTIGARTEVLDAEGDFVEMACSNEAEMWERAQQLGCDFIVNHMPTDYSALPSYEMKNVIEEYSIGSINAANESD